MPMCKSELFRLILLLQLDHPVIVVSYGIPQTYDELGSVRLLNLGKLFRHGCKLQVSALGEVVFLELDVI